MVEGVALELLCRLLFTEGSNPSLSVFLILQSSFLLNVLYSKNIQNILKVSFQQKKLFPFLPVSKKSFNKVIKNLERKAFF